MSSVDRELLADYVGGALAGTTDEDYVAHLVATSPQWHAAAEEMRAAFDLVDRDLGELRDQPEVMPADMAARFDELFAAPKKDPLAARPVAGTGGDRRRKWKRWAAPIAVGAAALAFGLGQVPQFATSLSENTMSRGGDAGSQADAPAAATAGGVPTIYTGTRYSRRDLGRSARMSKESAPFTGLDMGQVREGWQRFDQPQALEACLSAVSAAMPGRQNLVEFAFFEDRPALVISITTSAGEWSFVAGMSCGLGHADELHRAPQS